MLNNLRDFFSVNRPLIIFIYGQVFFILGLAITMQSRHYSRLNLARSLPWLAGFGFLHAINEWADLFIPIQSQYAGTALISFLYSIQHIFLAASFACLLQFGVELLRPFPVGWRWVRILPTFAFSAWFIGVFWMGKIFSQDVRQWHALADGLARYLLCIPGAWLSAYGLHHQMKKQIEPLGLPHISRTLNIAAFALATYGVFAGVLVPKMPFFPAELINSTSFDQLFIAPIPVFRSIAGIVLTFAIIRSLEVFNFETDRFIRQMEESQVVAIEHERIARDLHDGALQQVYAAGLYAQSLIRLADESQKQGLERLVWSINQAIDHLRLFLRQIQPDPSPVELEAALQPVINEARNTIPIETFWENPSPPDLQAEQISHMVAFTREALSNALRHSQTSRIEIRTDCTEARLRLSVRDFGSGLPKVVEPGYGLRNMRDRARLLGAELIFDSQAGKGTLVTLLLPMEKKDETHPSDDC